MISIRIEGMEGVRRAIANIEEKLTVSETKVLNERRANAFKEFVAIRMEHNGLGLEPIHEATKRIQGIQSGKGGMLDHPPLYKEGQLVHNMTVRSYKSGDADAGYFIHGGPKNAEGDSYHWIVSLHHLQGGYRIPLDSEGADTPGGKVRRWLKFHDVVPGKSLKFLHVKPRPFMYIGADMYVNSKQDEDIIMEYVRNMENTRNSTPVKGA